MHNPAHPGEVLREFFSPMGLTIAEGARRLGISRQSFSAILNGRGRVSAEIALRLSMALDTSPDLWLGMQMQYDLWQADRNAPKGVRKISTT